VFCQQAGKCVFFEPMSCMCVDLDLLGAQVDGTKASIHQPISRGPARSCVGGGQVYRYVHVMYTAAEIDG